MVLRGRSMPFINTFHHHKVEKVLHVAHSPWYSPGAVCVACSAARMLMGALHLHIQVAHVHTIGNINRPSVARGYLVVDRELEAKRFGRVPQSDLADREEWVRALCDFDL